MDRVQGIVAQVEAALPNFLALTNQIAAILANGMQLTSNLNALASGIRPAVSDVAAITANLRDPHGSLGEWLIPTNLNQQLAATLLNANGAITNANVILTNVNTNLVMVFDGVGQSLNNLAGITSNLNHQVQVNSNMLARSPKSLSIATISSRASSGTGSCVRLQAGQDRRPGPAAQIASPWRRLVARELVCGLRLIRSSRSGLFPPCAPFTRTSVNPCKKPDAPSPITSRKMVGAVRFELTTF